MQEINPFLSTDVREKLFRLCQMWQAKCVLLDTVTRCLHILITATSGSSTHTQATGDALAAVATELSNNRQWSYAEHPQWLAFEVLQRIMIRPRQHTVAQQLLHNLGGAGLSDKDRGAVLQVRLSFNYQERFLAVHDLSHLLKSTYSRGWVVLMFGLLTSHIQCTHKYLH